MFERYLLFPVQDQGKEKSEMAGKDGVGLPEGWSEFGWGKGRREGALGRSRVTTSQVAVGQQGTFSDKRKSPVEKRSSGERGFGLRRWNSLEDSSGLSLVRSPLQQDQVLKPMMAIPQSLVLEHSWHLPPSSGGLQSVT